MSSESITIPSGLSNPSTPYSSNEKSPSGSSSSSPYYRSPQTPSPASKSQGRKATHNRRPSLLSPAISKQECTVINIGDPEGPPRLISYLSSGQGFAWNPEIFLPSYIDYDYVPLENRRDPIHEIYLTDEEAQMMLPQ
ncbi:hypothetical protein SAPIO_CDS5030 [Scedosporium apiospermum]|uniref:Uncharacterized protein n=1 Tax=Pseudallescheria apiosperma TaxID=563466 RepID=A0A084G727_PSEDA|nr:uncharacterized protein SAPIO_CDS5030 [Scedosporium apiospermum]KEZ43139.1 hypothetical protein SAPIO_CDS5030 [Scedosporium apiospermum]